MSWVTVSEEAADGPEVRALYRKLNCSKFEATGILVSLWLWGIKNADESGKILNATPEDIVRYLYSNAGGSKVDLTGLFDALIESKWIEVEDGAMRFVGWGKAQKQWYTYARQLENDRKRKARTTSNGPSHDEEKPSMESKVAADTKSTETQKQSQTEKTKPKAKKGRFDYTDDFLKFWEIYPRRDKKSEAFECFRARLKEGYTADDLVIAAENYARQCKKRHTQEQYMMMARTFLGPHLDFADYLEKEPKKSKYEDGGNPFEDNPFDQFSFEDM